MRPGGAGVRAFPRLLAMLLLLAACEASTGATPPSGPAPSRWGQALFARIGYTPAQVRAAIGEPTRRTVEGNRETWIYVHPDLPGQSLDRTGTVTFVDGLVADASMTATLPT